jgi:excisionase family DNA binding protein
MTPTPTATAASVMMSVREAAAYLGISANMVYDLIRLGQLPHVRIGRRVLIPRQALDNWWAAQVSTPTGPPVGRARP